jgi:hypothetical protein
MVLAFAAEVTTCEAIELRPNQGDQSIQSLPVAATPAGE